MLTFGLILASCGSRCPGDATSGGVRNCLLGAWGNVPDAHDVIINARTCADRDCRVFRRLVVVLPPLPALPPATNLRLTCDC